MRLLLHACCGPCLIEPLECLGNDAESVSVVYSNSNIHPAEEYVRRRDTLFAYVGELGVPVVELAYEPATWLATVGPLLDAGPERCRACYRLRLREAARYAAENGFDTLATTLTVSPYQDPVAIQEAGVAAAAEFGIDWLQRDFRDRYPSATKRSRELKMYRQNYCGCEFSKAEAWADRESRRIERANLRASRAQDSGSPGE